MTALALALAAAAMSIATRQNFSGTPFVVLVPAVPYALFTVLAVLRMKRLRPRSGDLTFGAIVTVMLLLGAVAGRAVLAPHGSAREGWLIRIYQQVGDPDALQRHMVSVSLAVVVVAALEEVSWRGFVFPTLEKHIGTRRAWPATRTARP